MIDVAITYPYFVWSLMILILALLAIFITPRPLRAAVWFSGLFSVPSAFASIGFVPTYWKPVRIIEFLVGPEDVIFSFSTGVLSFIMAFWIIRRRFDIVLEPRSILLRFGLCYLAGYLINALFFNLMGMGPMQSALLTIGILGCCLVILRRELLILSFYGFIFFTVFYTVYAKIGFVIFPEFLNQWNHQNLSGFLPFGVPFEEIAWAAFCGAVWPLIMAIIINIRINSVQQMIKAHRIDSIPLVGDISAVSERS